MKIQKNKLRSILNHSNNAFLFKGAFQSTQRYRNNKQYNKNRRQNEDE